MALVLMTSVFISAQESEDNALPEKVPVFPAITLPSPETLSSDPEFEPVEFPGGKIYGDVRKEVREEGGEESEVIIIDGAIGFILKEDHPGGVLLLNFSKEPAGADEPVKTVFMEFPDDLHPQETEIDGRPVEIEILPKKGYLYMAIEKGKQILLSKVEFSENESLSDPETFDGIQLAIRPKFLPQGEEMKAILDQVKP